MVLDYSEQYVDNFKAIADCRSWSTNSLPTVEVAIESPTVMSHLVTYFAYSLGSITE